MTEATSGEGPATLALVIRVGLTGGIGSGKSTVGGRLRERGAVVVDADQLARAAVCPGSEALRRVVARFGDGILAPDGQLDRRALGRVVFDDPEARRALEQIIHPEVARLAAQAAEDALASGAPLFVYDVPLLFENDLSGQFDCVVVVYARLETRRRRLLDRDPLSEAELDARIRSQLPLEDKAARADHVIDNDGPLADTLAAVDALFDHLMAAATPAEPDAESRR